MHRIKKKSRGLFDEEFRLDRIKEKDPLKPLYRIDWESFRPLLDKAFAPVDYRQGGRPSFDRVMMFKVLILQEYLGLSDAQAEFQINDRMSFMKFLGHRLNDKAPDEKSIWLFRENLRKASLIDELFECLNLAFEQLGLIAKKGKVIDASFIKVPIQRNSRNENSLLKKNMIPEDWDENKLRQKDVDADWTKKNFENHYGYKQHIKADLKSKLVTNFQITPASENDGNVTEELLDKSDKGQPLYMDSCYHSTDRVKRLKAEGYRPRIQQKGYRYRKLTGRQIQRNRQLSRKRCRIEHIFAWTKQHGGNFIRGIGIVRVTAKAALRLMVYNMFRALFLRRTLRISVSN